MVSSPYSVSSRFLSLSRIYRTWLTLDQDAVSHYRWALQQRCYYTDLYNATTCKTMYERLPFCLEALQLAYQDPTVENRVSAGRICLRTQVEVLPGRSYENVEQRVSLQ